MLRLLAQLTALCSLATAGIAFYIYPDARFIPAWLRGSLQGFTDTPAITGPSFGLKVSLILVSFYLAQGLVALLSGHLHGAGKHTAPSRSGQIPFHFIEIPTILALVVSGVAYIPLVAVRRYTALLAGLAPLLTALELVSTMTVIMASGRVWSPKIAEAPVAAKIVVLLLCLGSVVASGAVIAMIYAWMQLSTLAASLLSSVATLVLVEIVACIRVEHATVTDMALLAPYVAYNIALIAWRGAKSLALERLAGAAFVPKNRLAFLHAGLFALLGTRASGLVLAKDLLATVFSPILVLHLLFQLAIIVLASRTHSSSDDVEDRSLPDRAIRFGIQCLWPLFGKSFLVIIYTASWLDQRHPETLASVFATGQLPWYLDAGSFWRWIAVFGALAWYGKHLVLDGGEDAPMFARDGEYKCDASFWRQFHNMRADD